MRYLTLGEVVALHRAIIERTGGMAGVRDMGRQPRTPPPLLADKNSPYRGILRQPGAEFILKLQLLLAYNRVGLKGVDFVF
jgi:hypothetical protein